MSTEGETAPLATLDEWERAKVEKALALADKHSAAPSYGAYIEFEDAFLDTHYRTREILAAELRKRGWT